MNSAISQSNMQSAEDAFGAPDNFDDDDVPF